MPQPPATHSSDLTSTNTPGRLEEYTSDLEERPPFSEIKQKLFLLLEEQAKVELPPLTQVPSSYGELLQAAFCAEWKEEQEKLQQCVKLASHEAELKSSFKALCAQRETVNQGSVLHYWASPESLCNQLYWDIATQLFAPLNLGEMISLLIPSAQQALVVETVINPRNKTLKKETLIDRWQLLLKIKSIQEAFLDYPAENPKALTCCVSGNRMVLSLEKVAELSFRLHQQLYDALDTYPKLKNNLYAHNMAFQQLLFDIEWHNKKGMSINTALTRFIEKLTLSGTRYTATEYAEHRATLACVEFRTYLDQLPEEFKQTLLNLTAKGFSLEGALNHLAYSGNLRCVETAASRLKTIQTTHFDFLDKSLSATEMQTKEIEQRYRANSLDLTGYQTSQLLPSKLCKKLLEHVSLNSTADYINCLLNLPTEIYESFLESVQILANPALPNKLADQLVMFSEDQSKAFFKAVIKNVDKFGGKKALLDFITLTRNNNPNFLPTLVALLPEHDRLPTINEKDSKGRPLLHLLVAQNKSEHAISILTLCPKQDRLAALNQADADGNRVLHYAIRNGRSDICLALLALCSKSDQATALNQKNSRGNTVLYDAALYNMELLWIFLAIYPENARLAALTQKDQGDDTLLHLFATASRPSTLYKLLALFPEQDRLIAITQTNFFNKSVLSLMACYQASFFLETISDLLPKYSSLTSIQPDLLSLPNVVTLALFSHLYVINQIFNITLEEQEHRGYFKSTQELRKKTLAQALNFIQKQIHEYMIANAKSPDLERRYQPAAFLSKQLKEINLLIEQKLIHSPALRKQKFLLQAGFILLNLAIFPVLLVRILRHLWDKKKYPEIWWIPSTPTIKRAEECQSKITELQQLVDQYKYQSKPYRLFYTTEIQNNDSDKGRDNFFNR